MDNGAIHLIIYFHCKDQIRKMSKKPSLITENDFCFTSDVVTIRTET